LREEQSPLRAFQASRRGGELTCQLVGDRVPLEGARVFYLKGEIEVSAYMRAPGSGVTEQRHATS
jgi:hypothetical protein